jgi:cardiolipin synthase
MGLESAKILGRAWRRDSVPSIQKECYVNIPNSLTLLRIVLVPLVVWLIITHEMLAAFLLFLFAGLSDAADGFLAKRYNWNTELGAYLDPIADKALLVSIYVTLGLAGQLPVWLVISVVSRDILIVGAVVLSWMLSRPLSMQPLLISKANTFSQIVLAGLVLAELGLGLGLEQIVQFLVWVTGTLTILSAAAYFIGWLRHMASYEPEPEPRVAHKHHAAGKRHPQRSRARAS